MKLTLRKLSTQLRTSVEILIVIEYVSSHHFINDNGELDENSEAYNIWLNKYRIKEIFDRLNYIGGVGGVFCDKLKWTGDFIIKYNGDEWELI